MANLIRRVLSARTKRGIVRRTYWVKPQEHEVIARSVAGHLHVSNSLHSIQARDKVRVDISHLSENVRRGVTHGVEAIGRVHTLPTAAPMVRAYAKWLTLAGKYSPHGHAPEIGVGRLAITPGLVFLKNFGHYVDNHVIGDGGGSVSGFGSHRMPEDMAVVMRTIYGSRAMHKMNAQLISTSTSVQVDRALVYRHFMKPHEAFARAYAQYIVTRAGKTELMDDLRLSRNLWARRKYYVYWENHDFRPIMRAMDRMFKDRGLS